MRCASSAAPPRRREAGIDPSYYSGNINNERKEAQQEAVVVVERKKESTAAAEVAAAARGRAEDQRREEGGCCAGGEQQRQRGMGKGVGKGSVVDEEFRPKRRFKVSGTIFEVDAKYELIKPIGHGAYGVVISALNTETGQKVAIKKITRAFDDLVDAKRILREITLLRNFDHENIISIVDILVPPSPEEFEDVYIVSDLMETDLHRIINSEQDLSLDHVQYFIYQVLRALKYMHSSNVLHRDLKPSNLLLNSNCDLKVCDLGLARDIESGCSELTEYVVTRWYRAPEIMLACQEYTKAIDLWSVGCIFAELMVRRPFFPGDNYIDQLTMICDKLGKPKEDEMSFVSTAKAKRFIMKLSDTTPPSLRDQFPATASDEALDLLSKMLEFNPDKRISVDGALNHPFMKNLHAAKEEPSAKFEFCFGFEEEEPRKHRLQELMWEEMRRFHPEQGPWKGKSNAPAKSGAGKIARSFSHLGRENRPAGTAAVRNQTSTVPLGRSPIIPSTTFDGANVADSSAWARSTIAPSTGGGGANVVGSSAGPAGPIANFDATNPGGLAYTPPAPAANAEQGPPSIPPAAASNPNASCPPVASGAMAGAERATLTATAVTAVVPASDAAVDEPEIAATKGQGRSTSVSNENTGATAASVGLASTGEQPAFSGSVPRALPSTFSSSTELSVAGATRARTRSTTRRLANNNGRASALVPSSHGCSSTVFGGIIEGSAGGAAGAAAARGVAGVAAVTVAAAVAAATVAVSAERSMPPVAEAEPDPVAYSNKRQRLSRSAQASTRREDTMAEGGKDSMPCARSVQSLPTAGKAVFAGAVVAKGSFQGAPADGTSEFLSQAVAGHEIPGLSPSTLGKRKVKARNPGAVGVIVRNACSPRNDAA